MPLEIGSALIGLVGVLVGVVATLGVQLWTAKQDRKQQLRLAAIDRRLETHQKAYELLNDFENEFYASVFMDKDEYVADVSGAAEKCREFWNRNCLYLEAKSREMFIKLTGGIHTITWSVCPPDSDSEDLEEIERVFNSALQTIASEVGLPEINEIPKRDPKKSTKS